MERNCEFVPKKLFLKIAITKMMLLFKISEKEKLSNIFKF